MRIAFTGKGGSGKTTLASLFARQMASNGYTVLALDADINQHLAGELGITTPLANMGVRIDEIKHHLRGNNQRFTVDEMQKTTPPGTGSNLLYLQENDWFIRTFTTKSPEGIYTAGAGEVPEGNIGVKCYHGLNGAIELTLGHLIDRHDEIVVVDMTAGADAFSSSLFAKVDALVLVVEPTLKSLSIYEQFAPHAKVYDVPLVVAANKIENDDDLAFIKDKIGKISAIFGQSPYIKQHERGQDRPFTALEEPFRKELHALHDSIARYERDWNSLERRAHAFHLRNSKSWMGKKAAQHIDPLFSLANIANK